MHSLRPVPTAIPALVLGLMVLVGCLNVAGCGLVIEPDSGTPSAEVTATSPATWAGGAAAVTATATDGSAVSGVTVRATPPAGGITPADIELTSATSGRWTGALTLPANASDTGQVDTYALEVIARDAHGRTASTSLTVAVPAPEMPPAPPAF